MTDLAVQEKEALEAGVQAVIYGLPLVMMDLTMKRATNVVHPRGAAAPMNQFASMRAFPTAAFKDVVRANVDTLDSSAFLDLSREPIVLSVPDTQDDPQSFFVDNPIHRHAISSWMPLPRNADGSIDVIIQHAQPDDDHLANWLPAPAGGFNITLRMYWPTEHAPSILDGSWVPPAVTRVGGLASSQTPTMSATP